MKNFLTQPYTLWPLCGESAGVTRGPSDFYGQNVGMWFSWLVCWYNVSLTHLNQAISWPSVQSLTATYWFTSTQAFFLHYFLLWASWYKGQLNQTLTLPVRLERLTLGLQPRCFTDCQLKGNINHLKLQCRSFNSLTIPMALVVSLNLSEQESPLEA